MKLKSAMRRKIWVIGFILFVLSTVAPLVTSISKEDFFSKSLHYTGEGMRYWYEEEGGFMDMTQIPYDQLDCKNCHVKSCDPCHAQKVGETSFFTVVKAHKMETCLACHSREGLTFKIGREQNTLDVHVDRGMVCADCHKGEDVHGNGTSYNSMRDAQAVKSSCMTCHTVNEDISAHTVHGDQLDCSACHVDNTTTCMNCHFDSFLETGKRKGNFFPMQDFMLLINYNGKVTSGAAMSMVYKGEKFILYTPYFTHAIQAKGRTCDDCHANSAMKLIEEGKSVPMMVFKDNKVVTWKGVVPTIPDKLEWAFLDKDGGQWVEIQKDAATKIQLVGYGTPLTEEQIEKMSMPVEE